MILTPEIIVVLALVGLAAYLFISERVRADVAAMLILALLGAFSITPGLEDLISPQALLAGFASDAVVAIIAVMIIGAGLDKTGIMTRLAARIVALGGTAEYRIMTLLSLAAGMVSAFIQNVGAIVLFLPVVSHIAARTRLATARLLIPVGFCTILGGNITLVGCSALILLNDLVGHANQMLSPEQAVAPFGLFTVAPVGLALLAAGIAYFLLVSRFVLPKRSNDGDRDTRALNYFQRTYGLDASVDEVVVPTRSPLVGASIREVQIRNRVRIIATHFKGRTRLCTPVDVKIQAPAVLAVIGKTEAVQRFVERNGLRLRSRLQTFTEELLHTRAGIAELVIPPNSSLISKTIRDVRMRETYALTLLAIHRGGQSLQEDLPEIPFQAGDALVCHTTWKALARLEKSRDFVVVTSDYPHEEERPHKLVSAMGFFMLALALVLFSDMRLGMAMLIGAIGMVFSGVLSMDEAYEAVSWKTVFLLAGMIPLGQAMQDSGAAVWIAEQTLALLGNVADWVLQVVLALMASAFSLVMSNVGATILLVPIAVSIAVTAGADPALYALIVALGTANAFLIPTNQVNALIMGLGDYKSTDFIRAGGPMTLIFLVVSLLVLNLMF